MKNSCCAVIGCPIWHFPWGYDEEDERCDELKLRLLRQLERLRAEGTRQFAVAMDEGVGLYAAEAVIELMDEDAELLLDCYVPFEGQATKWPPELRERYFNALSQADRVHTLYPRETISCEYEAKMAAIRFAGITVAVGPEEGTDKTFSYLLFNLRNMPDMKLVTMF